MTAIVQTDDGAYGGVGYEFSSVEEAQEFVATGVALGYRAEVSISIDGEVVDPEEFTPREMHNDEFVEWALAHERKDLFVQPDFAAVFQALFGD